jgi:hypothetical protein
VCTAVRYRFIRRHGAPVNSLEVDCKGQETIGMERSVGRSRRKGCGGDVDSRQLGRGVDMWRSSGRIKLTEVITFIVM